MTQPAERTLAEQRRGVILAEVRRTGAVRVSELTAALGVSDMTIRRDLESLAARGWVTKVHGGAIAIESSAREQQFAAKRSLQRPAKQAIARRAATMVPSGSSIGISAGTTTALFAEALAAHPGPLAIVTNSLAVAAVLPATAAGASRFADTGGGGTDEVGGGASDGVGGGASCGVGGEISVILTGGVRTPSAALVGAVADRAIDSLHVDRLFLGVHGMDAAAGLTTPNPAEAQTNARLIAQARQTIVVADSSKWGTVGLATIASLEAVDVVVTDDGLPDDARRVLRDLVGELVIVPGGGS